jgi:hypothetical protein
MAAMPLPPPALLQQYELVADAVRSVPVPKGVRLRRIDFDTDSTGYPAIHIVFAVSRRLGTSAAVVRSIGNLQDAVRDAVDAVIGVLQVERIPYVRFEDAR